MINCGESDDIDNTDDIENFTDDNIENFYVPGYFDDISMITILKTTIFR